MKNRSRLTALLLALVMLLSITASATEISDYTKSDYDADVLAVQSQTEAVTPASLTATDSGFNFAVTGEVPENAQLYVTYMGEDTTANIRSGILGLPELEEGMSEYAFDITIVENNAEWQPGTPVEVTITGVDTTENSEVRVYHIPDPAQPAVATLSLMDEETAVQPMEFEEVEATAGEGTVTFMADGFSVYYITTSGQATGETLANGESHTLYMYPGTSATLQFPNNVSNRSLSADNNRGDGISWSFASQTITVTAASSAQVGNKATITATWGNNNNRATINVTIISEEEADEIKANEVLDKFNNTAYPLYVTVRADGRIPNEPSVIDDGGAYVWVTKSGGNYNVGNQGAKFADYAEGLVSEDIVYHEKFFFEPYYAGQQVVGLVDGSGVAIREMMNGIDWDKVLQAVAANGGANAIVKDANGNERTVKITSSNVSNYRIVPYVAKLQEPSQGRGWHIDCAIVPKDAVILDYRLNIPDGVTLNTTIGLPNQQSGLPPADFDIGRISGITTITEGGTSYQNAMRVTYQGESYVFYFLGWDTKPDGTGSRYQPGNTMEDVEVDTTLYAIWNSNPLLGTGDLKITKLVAGEDASTDQEFTFKVEISNEEIAAGAAQPKYKYTVYNSNDVAVAGSAGTIVNRGTVSIKHSQYVIIEDIPAQNDEEGVPNVTVTETLVDSYTPSWEGVESPFTTVKIEGGRRSEVTCTNTMAPQTATLTISKSGMSADENAIFTVTNKNNADETYTVAIPNGGSVTISDLTIGNEYTITEKDSWSWRYEPVSESATIKVGGTTVNIVNKSDNDKWLSDETAVTNFSED